MSLLITEQTLNATSSRSTNNSEDSNACPTINRENLRENLRENVQEECASSAQSCEISDTEDKARQKGNTDSELSGKLTAIQADV